MPSEKIRELEEIFDRLREDTVEKKIVDGTYDVIWKNIEIKESKKGNKYVQIAFKVEGYETIYKRVMFADLEKKNIFCRFARDFGRLTDDLDDAIKYLNTLNLHSEIVVSDSEDEFYTVTVKRTGIR